VRSRFLVLAVLIASACASPTSPDVVALPAAAASIHDLTNAERLRAGLPALSASSPLGKAAQIQADQTSTAGVLGHVLPNAPYPHPQDRLSAVGYAWQAWAENLAAGQTSAEAVVTGWMQSSGHRANILSPAFVEMGTGYALDAHGRPYYVQVFGRPSS
jgi:uncharacterized protein YkwD